MPCANKYQKYISHETILAMMLCFHTLINTAVAFDVSIYTKIIGSIALANNHLVHTHIYISFSAMFKFVGALCLTLNKEEHYNFYSSKLDKLSITLQYIYIYISCS